MLIEKERIHSDCFDVIHTIESFYDDLAYSSSDHITSELMLGITNIDTIFLQSSKSTLESIDVVLTQGHITDAFSLLRKLYDNIVAHIYCLLNLQDETRLTDIRDWVKGKKKLPPMKHMRSSVLRNREMTELWRLLSLDQRYRHIRDYCNDNMHNNYFTYLHLNTDCHVDEQVIERKLVLFKRCLVDLTIFHFAYLLTVRYYYMASSDYVDHLDVGMQPAEDSQYWVAPFVQDFFNGVIKKRRGDIAHWMIENTCMKLE